LTFDINKVKARKVLKTKIPKRDISRRFASTTSKRPLITQPGFKKRRSLRVKARLTPKGTDSATGAVKRVVNTGKRSCKVPLFLPSR